ncbi:hypothetical protein K7432_010783 [Basidiobolus ranarum]|uniref:Carrier domain-containing protein n=1 Tax=Basidiobolus ranarum TaxID=34480 RepID=A0ABR2VUZ0_9FUNG
MSLMNSSSLSVCQFPRLLDVENTQTAKINSFRIARTKAISLSLVYEHPALKELVAIDKSILYASWVILLHYYTGNPDVAFGVNIHSPQLCEKGVNNLYIFQSTFGHETDSLPVATWLKQIADTRFTHEGPYCLYNENLTKINTCVIFSDQEKSLDAQNLEFAICIEGNRSEESINLQLTFADNYLQQDQGLLLIEQFLHVAQTLINNLDSPLGALNWTSDREKYLFLTEWQKDTSDYNDDTCIHYLFESQVKDSPDNVALQFEDKELITYSELNRRANRLAHSLILWGVVPDEVVALCIEKSIDMIVGILAVLKAGAAYVPLDAEYPRERIEFILEDTKAKICITTKDQESMFLAWSDLHLVLMDRSDLALDNAPESDPIVPELISSNLCYLIFTSGSTGKPKGVMLEHRSVVNYAIAHQKILNLTPDDRFLQFSNYTFDASILDIFVNLITGSRICLASKSNLLTNLSKMACLMKVTAAQLTTTVAALLNPKEVPTLKLLQQGGEMLTKNVRNAWAGEVKFYNGYGPTETTVYAIVNNLVKQSTSCTNIGWPMGRNKVYILNDKLELIPLGAVGELCIGGPQLARGYLNRPKLTEKSFVCSPFSAGERLYKSGDLGRFNPDGSITILGRKDNQVKLNGLRIEIEEIEYALNESIHVSRASVRLLNKESTKNKALVAFLTFESTISEGEAISIIQDEYLSALVEVQDLVRKKLPQYMVPTVWIPLTRMPVNTSGKVDFKMLEMLYRSGNFKRDVKEVTDSPSSPMEKLLQEVWSDVLNVEKSSIGTGNSFYHLGGDSISAIQISSQCRQKGVEVSVHSILQHPTIHQLVNYTQFTPFALEKQKIEEIHDEGTDIPLTPIQHQFFEVMQPNIHHFHLSWLVRMRHSIETPALKEALYKLISHHDILRARFSCENGSWRQWLASNEQSNTQVQQARIYNIEELKANISQVQQRINIETGPVSSFILYDLPSGKQLMFMTIHHYIIDLVSWRIIWEDLERLLNGQSLPYKTLSFRNWSKHLKTHAESLNSEDWPKNIAIQPLNIDTSKLSLNTMETVNTLSFTLDSEHTDLLFGRSNDAYSTEAVDIMLSALSASYCETFNVNSITIATEGHGREPWDDSLDISRTVGWFTSIYPITIESNPEDTIIDVLKQTKDTRRTIPNNGFTYGLLRYLNKEQSSSYSSDSMQVGFNYFGRFQYLEKSDSLFQEVDNEYTVDLNMCGPKWRRMNAIEVEVTIQRNHLCASISYSNELHQDTQINQWLQSWRRNMMEIIAICANKKERELTVSDIPLLNLNGCQLDKLMRHISTHYGDDLVQNIEDLYPCSPIQEGLIIGNIRSASFYHVQDIYNLPCGVDSDRLLSAWKSTIRDLPILRTVFITNPHTATIPGTFLQIILRHFYIEISHIFTDNEENDIRLKRYLEDDITQGFPLGKPNIRLCLMHGVRNRMIISRHHAINDGWSDKITMAVLDATYNNFTRPGFIPYKNYISFCIQEGESFNNEKASDYWATYLADIQPCNFPKLGNMGPHVKCLQFSSNCEIPTQILKDFSQKSGITILTLLQAAWGLILRPYYEKDDFIYGIITNGRNIPMKHIDQVVGPCINTLPFRIQYNEDDTVLHWLRGIHQHTISRIPFENCALQRIKQWCRLTENSVEFDAILNFQMPAKDSVELDSKHLVTFEAEQIIEPTEYRLCLNAWTENEKLCFRLDYNQDTLTNKLASCLLDRLNVVIVAIIGVDNEVKMGCIPAMSSTESDLIKSFTTNKLQMKERFEDFHTNVVGKSIASEEASLRDDRT